VAVPVYGADGTEGPVVASLSASGPTFRLTPERIPLVAKHLREAAEEISRRLDRTP
jgi:DNA-binding IclR family transcriptional regulator